MHKNEIFDIIKHSQAEKDVIIIASKKLVK